jgi:hypothetical protein
MIEFAFVMVINLMPEPFSKWEYVGNFNSCQEAVLYVNLHYPDPNKVEMEYKCLQKEYIHLPKDTQIINRDMKNGSVRYYDSHDVCKVKRNCTET